MTARKAHVAVALRRREHEVTICPMKSLARVLAFALALVGCGGRALTNADAPGDASMRTTGDAGACPAGMQSCSSCGNTFCATTCPAQGCGVNGPTADAAPSDGGPCPGMLTCFGCSGELYCADACIMEACVTGRPFPDAGAPTDAGYAPSPDGGICPAGMSLCPACGNPYCAATCLPPPPCVSRGGVPSNFCPDASDECQCYGSAYCGAEACASECAPRLADAGWCSSFYGPVSADQADAAGATACNGQCVEMLEIDASANGAIPVDYGCQTPTTVDATMPTCGEMGGACLVGAVECDPPSAIDSCGPGETCCLP